MGSQVMLMKPDHDSLNVVLLAAAHGSLPVRSFSCGQQASALWPIIQAGKTRAPSLFSPFNAQENGPP